MDISTLTDAVDEMCRTWAAFQQENDRATGRNEETLDKMSARMNQLETAIRRERRTPTSSGGTRDRYADGGPEVKAYFDYLRHGTRDEPNPGSEALTREEMKALTVGTDPTAGSRNRPSGDAASVFARAATWPTEAPRIKMS